MATDSIILNGVKHTFTIDSSNLHIEDSCVVPKGWFNYALTTIQNVYPTSDVWKRSEGSLRREWATHNMLYALGMWKDRTKDVDLNYPQKWYMKVAYNIVGMVALLFIK